MLDKLPKDILWKIFEFNIEYNDIFNSKKYIIWYHSNSAITKNID